MKKVSIAMMLIGLVGILNAVATASAKESISMLEIRVNVLKLSVNNLKSELKG